MVIPRKADNLSLIDRFQIVFSNYFFAFHIKQFLIGIYKHKSAPD